MICGQCSGKKTPLRDACHKKDRVCKDCLSKGKGQAWLGNRLRKCREESVFGDDHNEHVLNAESKDAIWKLWAADPPPDEVNALHDILDPLPPILMGKNAKQISSLLHSHQEWMDHRLPSQIQWERTLPDSRIQVNSNLD